MKPETSLKSEKSVLRTKLRQLRRDLDPAEKQLCDNAILSGLAALVSEHRPRVVASFWPFDGEPDLRPAMALLELEGAKLALPVIQEIEGGPSMVFRQWSSDTTMINNRYGIPEPAGTTEVFLFDIDLLLLPLVGWDESGGRLGMGAGFYDRALQPFARSDKPLRVGVAYQLQKAPQLPAEPWDIRLHGVLSEDGWFSCPDTPEI